MALLLASQTALAQPVVDVTRYGAVGDGVRDDGGAIQAAIDAAPPGATVRLPKGKSGTYRVTRTLAVNKALRLQGSVGISIRQARPGIPLFAVRASSVSLEALRLTGVQTAKWMLAEDGIHASGTFRPGRTPVYIRDLRITNCVIEHFGNAGIKILYADGVTVTGNTVADVVEVGIGLLSVRNATVSQNTVRKVSGAGVTENNAYGIYAVRLSTDAGNLVSQPRSQDIIIHGNTISDVPTWSGIDTHAGSGITITNNRIRNTNFGITVGTSKNHTGARAYAPLRVTVADNVMDSGVSDGSRQYGISFTGMPDGSEAVTGIIRDNRIIGYGESSSGNVPAVNVGATRNLRLSGNMVENPGAVGIYALGPNPGLDISRNVIVDPWSNSEKVGAAMGIRIVGDRTDAVILDNSILRKGKAAKFTLSGDTGFGIYVGPGRGNSGRIGGNINQARRMVEDPGRSLISD